MTIQKRIYRDKERKKSTKQIEPPNFSTLPQVTKSGGTSFPQIFWFKPSKRQEKYQFQAKMINIFEILKDISSKLLRFDCLGKIQTFKRLRFKIILWENANQMSQANKWNI